MCLRKFNIKTSTCDIFITKYHWTSNGSLCIMCRHWQIHSGRPQSYSYRYLFKGIVHIQIYICQKMYSPSDHPRCRWVCFFMWTDLEKCSITSLACCLILCSEWVPSEWESKQLIIMLILLNKSIFCCHLKSKSNDIFCFVLFCL